MKQEIKQNGETIIESDDNISIPIIFNNLTGKNSKDNKDYQAYIKYTAIPMMGFQYGKIECWENGILTRTGYITKLLLIT
ncbi:hypothetical protein IR083_00230 [Dysgonomonas sp. GY75]|uniref:DUF7688 family protein n=1 Tax=Dysgonomonas sp. GY75 TaxID=2780419 RepID=UPI0018839A68|nr:hypothetical protein [Dysgonomonas sp. GY75]MBF0647248.1 hypothetical protein [Dysgonomonas sp. GY75]